MAETSANRSGAPLRLHAERTGDPDTVRFVVGALGWSADGRWTPDSPEGCPDRLAPLLERGQLARIEVCGEHALLTRCPAADEWATLAAACRTAISEQVETVDDLTRARNIIGRGMGQVAESHGGGLRIVALNDSAVQVAMDGACRGCPAAQRTLRDGVLRDLRNAGIAVNVLGVAD